MPGSSAEETQGDMREVSTPILVQIAEANLGDNGWVSITMVLCAFWNITYETSKFKRTTTTNNMLFAKK